MIIHTPVLEQNKTLYRCHIKFSLSLFNFVNKFSMYLQNFVSDVCMHVYMYVMAWLKVFDIGCMCSIWNLLLYFIKYMYITDIWSWQTERGRNRLIEYLIVYIQEKQQFWEIGLWLRKKNSAVLILNIQLYFQNQL